MNRMNRWLSLLMVLTLGFLLGMLGFSLWDKIPSTALCIAWSAEAQWITPPQPSYRFYTRRTFYLADTVQAAWLRLSADDDFILYVNGQAIAQEVSVLGNSLGLASRLSEPFQLLNDSVAYHFPGSEWSHLSNARDWKLTAYIDLTAYLRSGKNVIALEIQKGRLNPRVVVQGAVYPVPGAPGINLTTGATPWQVSTLAENRKGLPWFDPDFPDQSWLDAVAIGPIQEATYSRLSQHLFDRLLHGSWITGTESPDGEVWLRGDWQVPQSRDRAFIRLAGNGEYALLINGLLVKRYEVSDSNQLHMYEVTNFLKTGHNTLAVRLARPLAPDWSAARNGVPQNGLGFFLDGWVESPYSMTAPIATDSTWSALTEPISGWAEGVGQGQPATVMGSPDPQEFQRQFEGNAYLLNYPDYLWHNSLWCSAGVGWALISAWGLGRFWLGRRDGWWDSFGAGAGLLLPGTLFLIGIGLLKHRYAEAERGLLFVQPQNTPLVLLGFVVIVVLMLLWSQIGWRPKYQLSLVETLPRWCLWFLLGLMAFMSLGLVAQEIAFSQSASIFLIFFGFSGIVVSTQWGNLRWSRKYWFEAVLQTWSSWGQWFFLVLIVGVGFSLRAYNLDFIGLESDESTSFDAARGILRTGAPEASSGIWYTRGPLYHYMLALWLRLVGFAVNARFLSVVWGTATLVLIFILTRKITGKVWIALVVTAILAIDPFEIWYSRFLRFYQVLQFLSLLSLWLFLKGFVQRSGRVYQYAFFIILTGSLLTQEVTVTLLPCFFLGFVCFYRPFLLSIDWPIVLSSLTTMGIFIYDLIFFSIKCLTPLVAISSSTAAQLKLHLSDITNFIFVLFIGPSRIQTLYSFFFFLGFVYFFKRRDQNLVFLFSVVLLNLVIMIVLVFQGAVRYTYPIYPLFIMLSVSSAISLVESLGRKFELILKGLLPLKNIAVGFVFLLLISNTEPGRVLDAYRDAITARNAQVAEYIHEHRQPGDLVISNVPAVYAITGGLDYYLPHRVSIFDALYWHEGRVIDRWAGGVFLSNLDQMSHVLEKAKRVWIHLRDTQPPRDPKLAEFYNYFQALGQPALETFGVRLRLWQREDGLFPHVPNQGKDIGVY